MAMEGDNKFPIGLRVLVVDDNLPCLKIIERLLMKCKYQVTMTTEAVTALKMLRENKEKFDIVISDVHMPGMNGFKLLELIGLELDLPVIMLSANEDPKLVMKGVRHGAVDYLIKPVRIEELQNIWQHVIRKTRYSKQKGKSISDSDDREDGSIPEETKSRKRKEQNSTENNADDRDEDDECSEDSNPHKKPRVVWSPELHKKFVAAVDQLGPENAFPKKILDFMNVEGLTRENVASHLQKYRLYLKRLNSPSSQQTDITTASFGIQDSSIYMNGGSLLGSYNMYGATNYRSSLLGPSNIGKSLLSNQNMGHFQHQNNQGLLKPHASVPSLEDYTRNMENWKSRSTLARQNNGGQYSLNAQNVGCNIVESQRWQQHRNGSDNISAAYNMDNHMIQNIDSSSQSFARSNSLQYNSPFDSAAAQISGDGTDVLMRLDDSFLLEDTDLLAEFTTQNNCETLEDLVGGLLK